MTDPIEALYSRYEEILTYLSDNSELSFATDLAEIIRKSLLLSIASYFEARITGLITEFVKAHSNSDLVEQFVQNKALKRQYHTLFSWQANNANSFFSLFGQGFKERCASAIQDADSLPSAIKAFLELGNLRNLLVHSNYATFPLDKTPTELYELYRNANEFLDFLGRNLS